MKKITIFAAVAALVLSFPAYAGGSHGGGVPKGGGGNTGHNQQHGNNNGGGHNKGHHKWSGGGQQPGGPGTMNNGGSGTGIGIGTGYGGQANASTGPVTVYGPTVTQTQSMVGGSVSVKTGGQDMSQTLAMMFGFGMQQWNNRPTTVLVQSPSDCRETNSCRPRRKARPQGECVDAQIKRLPDGNSRICPPRGS